MIEITTLASSLPGIIHPSTSSFMREFIFMNLYLKADGHNKPAAGNEAGMMKCLVKGLKRSSEEIGNEDLICRREA